MFCRQDDVFHPRLPGQAGPIVGVEVGRVKLLVEIVVNRDRRFAMVLLGGRAARAS